MLPTQPGVYCKIYWNAAASRIENIVIMFSENTCLVFPNSLPARRKAKSLRDQHFYHHRNWAIGKASA